MANETRDFRKVCPGSRKIARKGRKEGRQIFSGRCTKRKTPFLNKRQIIWVEEGWKAKGEIVGGKNGKTHELGHRQQRAKMVGLGRKSVDRLEYMAKEEQKTRARNLGGGGGVGKQSQSYILTPEVT